MKEREEKQELDMETTVADMNVEGLPWYDPSRKNGKKTAVSLSKKEERALIRGAFRAMFPMICSMLLVGLIMVLFAYLWLK